MSKLRSPAVAGMFYPADPDDLRDAVCGFLADCQRGAAPKAMIVPHAGYIYSGPVAATAYARLSAAADTIRRVVLLGPSHYVGFHGLAATEADFFTTPLGSIPLDKAAIKSITHLPQVLVLEQAHVREHSLEVQLPFLQTVLKEFKLVPLVVGEAEPDEVSEVLEVLWGGAETLIIISSDLSHYHDYITAQAMDRAASKAIEELLPDALSDDQACGHNPVKGLLKAAAHHGLHTTTLDLRNSGDTAGSRERVVGYGAYAFF